MDDFVKDLTPVGRKTLYRQALKRLAAAKDAMIGHIDTGITKHPGLGFSDGSGAPKNIIVKGDADLLDGGEPYAKFGPKPEFLDKITDYPDHGTKTLSVILSDDPQRLLGIAPGVRVIPVRIADGPIFQSNKQLNLMGDAIRYLLNYDPVPRVITISMGNPGNLGPIELVKYAIADLSSGLSKDTKQAIDEAYEKGVVICAAGGQIIDRVVFPARLQRTIGVGGLTPENRHYPPTGYDKWDAIDIWATASNINRAASTKTKHYWAEDGKTDADKVSGTSYATPQVAAAAALWIEWNRNLLPKVGDPEAWRVVEATRAALRDSALGVNLRRPLNTKKRVRRLDVEHLLETDVPDFATLKKRPSAVKHWNLG